MNFHEWKLHIMFVDNNYNECGVKVASLHIKPRFYPDIHMFIDAT